MWIILLRDTPQQARWMTTETAAALEQELAAEQATVAPVAEL